MADGERPVPRLSAQRMGPANTPKERVILAPIAEGKSNKEIAAVPGSSEDTVKRHVSNILDELRVNDRAQASVEAIRREIVTVAE